MRRSRRFKPASMSRNVRLQTLEALEARVVMSLLATVSGPSTAVPGTEITFKASVFNDGPNEAGATLIETLPSGVSFVSASDYGAYSPSNNTVSWNTGQIDVDATDSNFNVNVNVATNVTGSLTDSVSTSAGSSDCSVPLTPKSNLEITLSNSVSTYTPGASLQYTVHLSNGGPSAVTGAVITDPLPPETSFAGGPSGMSYDATTNTVRLTTGTLSPGQGMNFNFALNTAPTMTGSLVNAVTVTPPTGTTNTNSNNTAIDTETAAPQADLSVSVSDGTSYTPGNTVSGNIQVINHGPSTVTGAVFTDPLPAGTTFVGAGGGATYNATANTVSLTLGTLAPGEDVNFNLNLSTSSTLTGSLTNTVYIAAPVGTTDPNQSNNSFSATLPSTIADVGIAMSEGVGTYIPGTSTIYTMTVSNPNATIAAGTTVTDTLPAGMTYVSASGPSGATVSESAGVVTYTLGQLATNSTSTLYLTLSSSAPVENYGNPVYTLTNTAALVLPDSLVNTSSSSQATLSTPVGYYISMDDAALEPTGSSPEITTPYPDEGYTLRQLVNYYDTSYDSSQPLIINLAGGTYNFAALSPGGNSDTAELLVNNPDGKAAGRGALEIENGTINANFESRVFEVSGASLQLNNVTVEHGKETGQSSTGLEDAVGGGILVDNSGSLTITGTTITQNEAAAHTGIPITANGSHSGRMGAGFNASGGGIYGAGGSTISIDSTSVITGNVVEGGKGGAVNDKAIGHGGAGGGGYGAGIAIEAPTSGSSTSVSSSPAATLTIAGGASINSNLINQMLNGTKLVPQGGTGGNCSSGGPSGAGGNAFGAGLYVGSGQLNLNGPSAIQVDQNSGASGPPSTTSTTKNGPVGLADGAFYFQPGLVTVSNSPTSGGILQFTGNTENNASAGLYLPPVTTGDQGYISTTSPWDLRTAIAAVNPLVSSGMDLTLNLPTGTFALSLPSGSSGATASSLSVTDTGAGSLTILGTKTSTASSIISGEALTGYSIFSLDDAHVIFSNLTISGGNSSSGGAINAINSTVTVTNASITTNTSSNKGGGIYQSGGTLLINSSTLTGNTAPEGGGLFVDTGSHSTISGTSQVNSNHASTDGGGIFANDANIVLSGITLNLNTSASGGGIYQTGGTVGVSGATKIESNDAIEGGGVFVSGDGAFTMTDGSVLKNALTTTGTNPGEGAGIALYESVATFKTVGITSNSGSSSASNDGGGIYQSGGTITLTNSQIKANSAGAGGGIFLNGGPDNATLKMGGGALTANTATSDGGGIDESKNANGCAVSLASVAVTGNTAASAGGGLYQNTGSTLALTSNSTVQGNTAPTGGGIFSNGTLSLISSAIKANTATIAGAGLASTKTILANFTKANVSSNTINATGTASGAGLYLSGGTLNTDGFTLNDNVINTKSTATIQGGGIYDSGTSLNFNGGTTTSTLISSNTLNGIAGGSGYGAGIYLVSATLTIQSSITYQNNAINTITSGVGGAVAFFAYTTYTTTSYSVTSTGNIAFAGGNDYAFVVPNQSDVDNYVSTENGSSGINYFTSGAGSLRSAVSYCENWMNGNANDHSMAIILPSVSGNYILDESGSGTHSSQPITTSVASGDGLTIIGSGGRATIQGWFAQTLIIDDVGSLVLQNLEITGGDTHGNGGGIYQSSGSTTLNDAVVTGNVAGPTGTAANTYKGATATWNNAGKSGASGASGYGGGIYLGSGTLTLTSNCSITGNTVHGQNGNAGQKGGQGSISHYTFFQKGHSGCSNTKDGGNGGNGGSGGAALGGGLYQAGGTLNSASGSSIITGNTSTPGTGGKAGAGGNSGTASGGCTGPAGKPGTAGATGHSAPNYSHAVGATVFTKTAANSAALVVAGGGLYSSAGTLSPDTATAPSLNRLPGVVVELHASNGTLIAKAVTDSAGTFHFDTTWSGLGYVQMEPISIFTIAPKGSIIDGEDTSSLDAVSRQSSVVQFIDGVSVSQSLDFTLQPVQTHFISGQHSVSLEVANNKVLWTDQLMPASYHGGFDLFSYDIADDRTPDYILLTNTGPARLFIIDGRTGAVSTIAQPVSKTLRVGLVIQEADVIGGIGKQFLIYANGDRSGPISLIDPSEGTVLWTTKGETGGQTVSVVSSETTGMPEVQVVSAAKAYKGLELINAQTGAIIPRMTMMTTSTATTSKRVAASAKTHPASVRIKPASANHYKN